MQLTFAPIGPLAVVGLLAVVLVGTLFWGPARSRLTPQRRRVLLLIRAAVVLLMVLALLAPTVVYTKVKRQSATVVVLADRSRSMLVSDAVGSTTRWNALKSTLDDAAPALVELGEEFLVKVYGFDSEAKEVPFDSKHVELGAEPTGHQTALGNVLDQVLKEHAGERIAAVIMLSDGAQRAMAPRDMPPQVPARRLADLGYRLFTCAFGQARGIGQAQDVALADLVVPSETVFVKNQLAALGTVRIEGYPDAKIPVQLWFETAPGKMELKADGAVTASSGGGERPIELTCVPETPGEHKLTMKIPPQAGELLTSNNELSTFITVLKGGINVLYLEGSLERVEKRFLRAALDSSPNLKVDYFYIDAKRPESRPADLAERLTPGKYDVVILGDLDSAAFRPEELQSLARSVERGAGLVMLGGFHSFGPGGYQRTPLVDVLPIEMDELERQGFDEPVSSDMHLDGEVRVRPTPEGERHYVMLLGGADTNAKVWADLPALEGANRFRRLKPRATVLAQSATGDPLLVAQDVGAGRVIAFAGDSTWHWVLEGHETEHKRFWRQMVLWLAHKEQSNDGQVWVELDPRRYAPGQKVEFTAGARGPDGDPVVDAVMETKITMPDGSSRGLAMVRQSDQARGTFLDTLAPGDYQIEVQATRAGQLLGTAQARFLVYEQDLELDNPAADPQTLAALAAMTHGEAVAPEQLTKLLERLLAEPEQLEVQTLTKRDLWDTWPFFLLFVGLLTTEWTLRKRWGLV